MGCIARFMGKIVGSILHGAYGDLYEQALCLKHFVATHPGVELRLFAATPVRLDSFSAVDLSFALSFELWTAIESRPEIAEFFQFQVQDRELRSDVVDRLSPSVRAKFDLETNHLPWDYMREHKLIPEHDAFTLPLNAKGRFQLGDILNRTGAPHDIWTRPTISFLWRYRKGAGAIRSFGQKSEQQMVTEYSRMFRQLIEETDCHVLVFGMNIVTTDTNRERTDNKYPPFGLELPPSHVTYFKGLSWPIELEIASLATVCCGHASGFTEGLWLKRGRDTVLMDAPPHYLAKIAYHRMPLFDLKQPANLVRAFLMRSPEHYGREISAALRRSARTELLQTASQIAAA